VHVLERLEPRSASMLDRLKPWDSRSPATIASMVPDCFDAYCTVWHVPTPHESEQCDSWELGTLPQQTCLRLAERLRPFAASERWVFAVWDGYGWKGDSQVATRLQIPHRSLMIFEGGSADVDQVAVRNVGFQSPTLWWPVTCDWLVRTDLDEHFSMFGGSIDSVEAVLRDPDLVAKSTNLEADVSALESAGPE